MPADTEILALLDTGLTGREIAARLGCSEASVSRAKKRAGRALTWSPIDWEEIDPTVLAMYRDGALISAIATRVGVSESSVSTRLATHGLTGRRPTPVVHGIPQTWMGGCKCEVCEPARQAYKRAERERARERGPITHGIAGRAAGCDCRICVAAALAVLRERQARTLPNATAHRAAWTGDDDAIVTDKTRTIEAIAGILGRTYAAVSNRRKLLKRRMQNANP